ncbi:tetratricopeptide repeat protein [Lentzea aerocolonigenes]|uniref:tetratricopeptide repeat protein n=1 Tax=Lentzea aerocolonigenes TaxID=68170 RepID=UPI0004C2D1D6|nr:tetratricopeptide repeat protein [Lentzea aerocolonigenes]MCP2243870.1 Tetratricopeptide repeat-containing protein [Lentzea aerocolonigenes]
MPSSREPTDVFAAPPDPGPASSLDDLVLLLRLLKVWAGDPSYEVIKDRVNAAWTAAGRPESDLARKNTVADCFRPGRRRWNNDLVVAVVQALHADVGYAAQWRQALRVVGGETKAASQVRVQDTLPEDLAEFTGRTAELDRLREALRDGDAVVISALEGMAGIGKTQLAIHAGHLLADADLVDRVLFVNLRGFHPDPAQPPADPAAVLDGFLRLLGVPGHQIPHDLDARAAAYRDRLHNTRTLVILDNAATEDQVRPLLSTAPGCPTLITSRRSLTALAGATHLPVDVFTPEEAVRFLADAAPAVPVGPDPAAPARIALRCGYLPLALGLVTARIAATPGWTLTDHADRLDERHRDQRLDSGVELALGLSYQDQPADRRRLLRLLALHPGQDVDAHAAAALTGTDLRTVHDQLDQLRADHLLQQTAPGRYTFHDLVRAYAATRAADEDRPADRRAALTRLFDYYLATVGTAMDHLYPAQAEVPSPVDPAPALTDPDTSKRWLDVERPNLVAVAAHSATHGWQTHTIRLAEIMSRYFDGGHFTDALAVHGHACRAAQDADDPAGQATALLNLGTTNGQLGRYRTAADQFEQALVLFRQTGDLAGQARAQGNLGNIEQLLGRYQRAAEHYEQVQALFRQAGDRTGEAYTLSNLGTVEGQLGRYDSAAEHLQQALDLFRAAGDRAGESYMLIGLGGIEVLLGRYGPAADHLQQALVLCRQVGNRAGEGWTLDSLGKLHTQLGEVPQALERHQQALDLFRETGDQPGEAWALNGLGEVANATGRPAWALAHHEAALTIATDLGTSDQQARAHAGLGQAHHAMGDAALARQHYEQAVALYTDLGMPQAEEIRARLAALEQP